MSCSFYELYAKKNKGTTLKKVKMPFSINVEGSISITKKMSCMYAGITCQVYLIAFTARGRQVQLICYTIHSTTRTVTTIKLLNM